jgi:hypothetical protein
MTDSDRRRLRIDGIDGRRLRECLVERLFNRIAFSQIPVPQNSDADGEEAARLGAVSARRAWQDDCLS